MDEEQKPYVFQEYPKWLNIDGGMIVNNAAEEESATKAKAKAKAEPKPPKE